MSTFEDWFNKQKLTKKLCELPSVKCKATGKSCGKHFISVIYNNESRGSFLNIPVMYAFLLTKFGKVPESVKLATTVQYLKGENPLPGIPSLVNFKVTTSAKAFTDYCDNYEGQALDWDYWNNLTVSNGHTCTGTPKKRKRTDKDKKSPKVQKQKLEGRKYYWARNNNKKYVECDDDKAKAFISTITNSKQKNLHVVTGMDYLCYGKKADDNDNDNNKKETTHVLDKINPALAKLYDGKVLVFPTKTKNV